MPDAYNSDRREALDLLAFAQAARFYDGQEQITSFEEPPAHTARDRLRPMADLLRRVGEADVAQRLVSDSLLERLKRCRTHIERDQERIYKWVLSSAVFRDEPNGTLHDVAIWGTGDRSVPLRPEVLWEIDLATLGDRSRIAEGHRSVSAHRSPRVRFAIERISNSWPSASTKISV